MLKDLKQTLKHSLVYGVSRVSSKLTGFVLLPLYSGYFSTDTYGIIVRIELIWQFLFVIFLFGLESGIIRWYSINSDDKKKKQFLFTVFIFLLVFNIILLIIIFFSSGFLSNAVFETGNYSKLIMLAGLIAFPETIIFVIFLIIRINEKPFLYTSFSILITLANLFLQIYFIVYTDIKLEGIFYAKILSPLLGILLLIPYIIKFIKPGFLKNDLKELLKYSFPILLGSTIWMIIIQLDKFFLGFLTNSSEVGIYGFASSITGVINFIVLFPFSLAFTVIAWKKYKEENPGRFFSKIMTYLYFTVIYFSLMISLFIGNVIKIFIKNPDYYASTDLIPVLCLSIPLVTIHFVGIFSFQASDKTKYITYIYIIGLILNITFNWIFISIYKSYGAAFANILTFLTLNVVIQLLSRKCFYWKYEWIKYFVLNLSFFILVIPFYLIIFNNVYIELLLKFLAVFIFPFLLYIFGFYEKIEKETISRYIKKLF